jgi:hypothetical protein
MMTNEDQGKAALVWMRVQAKAIDSRVDDSYSVADLARIITFNVPKEVPQQKLILPDNVKISDCSLSFYQDSDSCQNDDNGQELSVKTEDNGAGKYLIVKTERWAIDGDEIDQFASIFKQIINLAENSGVKK